MRALGWRCRVPAFERMGAMNEMDRRCDLTGHRLQRRNSDCRGGAHEYATRARHGEMWDCDFCYTRDTHGAGRRHCQVRKAERRRAGNE